MPGASVIFRRTEIPSLRPNPKGCFEIPREEFRVGKPDLLL
jgi:hypothetical protein